MDKIISQLSALFFALFSISGNSFEDIAVAKDEVETALFTAVSGNRPTTVKALLFAKADVSFRDQQGRTPLLLAAYHGHAQIIEILLAHDPKSIKDHIDSHNALMVATEQEHPKAVHVLLNHDQKAVLEADIHGMTAAMMAAENSRYELVEILLDARADINATNTLGTNILQLAEDNPRLKEIIYRSSIENQMRFSARILRPDSDGFFFDWLVHDYQCKFAAFPEQKRQYVEEAINLPQDLIIIVFQYLCIELTKSDPSICSICLDRWIKKKQLFPCQHIVCKTCASMIGVCPFCSSEVQAVFSLKGPTLKQRFRLFRSKKRNSKF